MVKKTDNPGVEEVRNYIRKILEDVKSKGIKEFEINARRCLRNLLKCIKINKN